MEQTVSKAAANSKDVSMKAANTIGTKVGEFISDASENVQYAKDQLSKQGEQIAKTYRESVRNIETSVRSHPLKSVLIAGGVGLAAGALISLARRVHR